MPVEQRIVVAQCPGNEYKTAKLDWNLQKPEFSYFISPWVKRAGEFRTEVSLWFERNDIGVILPPSPQKGRVYVEDDRSGGQQSDTASEQRSQQMELRVLNEVVAALQTLSDNERRERVIEAAAAFFRLSLSGASAIAGSGRAGSMGSTTPSGTSFSEDRTMSPKDFLITKQPQTEVERVACLAYYLTHYRDTPYFKTIDISSLNTEAAQPKFGNAAQAVDNAMKTHYLASASKGAKQLSAAGELFVQALPDRDAARAAMASMRPRRRKKSVQQMSNSDQNSGDE